MTDFGPVRPIEPRLRPALRRIGEVEGQESISVSDCELTEKPAGITQVGLPEGKKCKGDENVTRKFQLSVSGHARVPHSGQTPVVLPVKS